MKDSEIIKDQEILYLGKSLFALCLVLGSMCLIGYLTTRMEEFAIGGYMLLVFGAFLNILVILGLLIYGCVYRSRLNECLKAIGILLINIPIAILYTAIGLNSLH
jgi:LIVCS family branched-chain amino acid:cation transporter